MEDAWSLVGGAARLLLRVFLSVAEWVYVLGRRPGHDWTTGRRSGPAYRLTWQLGRVMFWGTLVAVGAILIYLVYFFRGGL